MDRDAELFLPILEILEILKSPTFSIIPEIVENLLDLFSPILDILAICFLNFPISCKCGRRAGGSRG